MYKINATLLIIDDDEVVRESLAAHLENSNFRVLQALNGLQGPQIFESKQPDLVIYDLRTLQIDGLELIRRIRQTTSETPITILSKAGMMSNAVETLRLDAADYLIRPLEDLAVLKHSVYRALDYAYLRVENRRYRDRLEAANRKLQASLNLFQEDQSAGRQVQMNMLPMTPWNIEGLELSYRIIPSLYLSDGFIDYFRVGERRVVLCLADVSGHGASSALVTVLLKFMIMRLSYESRRNGTFPELKPPEVLAYVNHGPINAKLGKHVIILGGVIDLEKNGLTYSIGSHLPLPVLLVDGQTSYLKGHGLLVDLFDDVSYDDQVMELPLSFSPSLFSDGILDILPGAVLKEKEVPLSKQVVATGGILGGLHQVFGLANLAEMPDNIALLVLSRNLA